MIRTGVSDRIGKSRGKSNQQKHGIVKGNKIQTVILFSQFSPQKRKIIVDGTALWAIYIPVFDLFTEMKNHAFNLSNLYFL